MVSLLSAAWVTSWSLGQLKILLRGNSAFLREKSLCVTWISEKKSIPFSKSNYVGVHLWDWSLFCKFINPYKKKQVTVDCSKFFRFVLSVRCFVNLKKNSSGGKFSTHYQIILLSIDWYFDWILLNDRSSRSQSFRRLNLVCTSEFRNVKVETFRVVISMIGCSHLERCWRIVNNSIVAFLLSSRIRLNLFFNGYNWSRWIGISKLILIKQFIRHFFSRNSFLVSNT